MVVETISSAVKWCTLYCAGAGGNTCGKQEINLEWPVNVPCVVSSCLFFSPCSLLVTYYILYVQYIIYCTLILKARLVAFLLNGSHEYTN